MASVKVSGSALSMGLWLEGLTFTNDSVTSGEINRVPSNPNLRPDQNRAELELRKPDPKTVGLVWSNFDFVVENCDFTNIDKEVAKITITDQVLVLWKRTTVRWSFGCCRGVKRFNSISPGIGIHNGTWRIK